MIRKAERALTEREIGELTRAGRTPPWSPVSHAIGALLTGVPGLGCVGIVAALWYSRGGLPPQSLWVVAVLAGVLGLIGLGLIGLAARHVLGIAVRPRPTPARMDRQTAESIRATEWTIGADQAWRVEMGDDDVPSLLVRSGDRCVYFYSSELDDLWEGDDPACWESIGSELTCVVVEGSIYRLSASGSQVPIGCVVIEEAVPRRGEAWWLAELREMAIMDLPTSVRAQMQGGH